MYDCVDSNVCYYNSLIIFRIEKKAISVNVVRKKLIGLFESGVKKLAFLFKEI